MSGTATGPTEVKIAAGDNGPVCASLVVTSKAEGCKSLTREVRLVAGSEKVEFIDTVDKVSSPSATPSCRTARTTPSSPTASARSGTGRSSPPAPVSIDNPRVFLSTAKPDDDASGATVPRLRSLSEKPETVNLSFPSGAPKSLRLCGGDEVAKETASPKLTLPPYGCVSLRLEK